MAHDENIRKPIVIKGNELKKISRRVLAQLQQDQKWLQERTKILDRTMEEISTQRFSTESSWAFNKLKRITKYNEFSKRDGGIVQRALFNDT